MCYLIKNVAIRGLVLGLILGISQVGWAFPITLKQLFIPQQIGPHPWSVMVYYGNTVKQDINDLIQFKYTSVHEKIVSVELARIFYKNYFSVMQIAGNLADRIYEPKQNRQIPEGDIYVVLRFNLFPWEKYLLTTAAIGEQIMPTTPVPDLGRTPNLLS